MVRMTNRKDRHGNWLYDLDLDKTPSLGWCDGVHGKRHTLYSWGNWRHPDAPSLSHGRGCSVCGKKWGWLYTTHQTLLRDMDDPEVIAQAQRNKRDVSASQAVMRENFRKRQAKR